MSILSLHCTLLNCNILHCNVPAMYSVALHCITLHCFGLITPHYLVLHSSELPTEVSLMQILPLGPLSWVGHHGIFHMYSWHCTVHTTQSALRLEEKKKLHELRGVQLFFRFSAKLKKIPLNLDPWTCQLKITLKMESS